MFMRVIHLNKLVVTKRVLLSGGIKIQDGCQSWPLIAAKFFFTLGLVFMINDNVDNKKMFLCMTQGPFINCQLWKMAKGQKENFL